MKSLTFLQIALLASALFVGLATAQDGLPPEFEVGVMITNVSYGDTDEWVEISNPGSATQDFTFWTLADQGNSTYTFPEGFILAPEGAVKVHTEVGNDTATDLYWGSEESIWDEDELATLMDANGEIVSQYPEAVVA